MSLLGTLIDSRTLAAIAASANSTFAHGLPATPDEVFVQENTTTNNSAVVKLAVAYDATNVTIYNHGADTSATLKVTSKVFHSVIR